MFEQLSKPLKMDGIQISLLNVVCLTSMQNVVTRKRGKMITYFFGSKFYLWMGIFKTLLSLFLALILKAKLTI
jgi:hypothetical protein